MLNWIAITIYVFVLWIYHIFQNVAYSVFYLFVDLARSATIMTGKKIKKSKLKEAKWQ